RDSELVEQVKNLDLRLERRIHGGRALDAVAEGLVQHLSVRELPQVRRAVPVVEEVLLAHADRILCGLEQQRDPLPASDAGGADAAAHAPAPHLVEEV